MSLIVADCLCAAATFHCHHQGCCNTSLLSPLLCCHPGRLVTHPVINVTPIAVDAVNVTDGEGVCITWKSDAGCAEEEEHE